MRPHHPVTAILRAFAMLALLVVGSTFLECATTPGAKPTPNAPDGGASSPCDVACANPIKLKCKFASECPSVCRLLSNPALLKCITEGTTCLMLDGCNQPH